jgi:hypothetical protein
MALSKTDFIIDETAENRNFITAFSESVPNKYLRSVSALIVRHNQRQAGPIFI